MIPLRDHIAARRAPVVTYALIAANVLAFIWEMALVRVGYQAVVFDWGLVPARFAAAPSTEAVTLLSSMFMHAPDTWWHLGGNMLFLWVFGDNVEDAMGRWRFLGFYLLAGAIAGLTQVAIYPDSLVPMVGASGAIAGVLAGYGSLHPRVPVTVLNPLLPLWLFFGPFLVLPAWVLILEFFALNLIAGMASLSAASQAGGVAFFAHLGGFIAGLFLVRLLVQLRPLADPDPWEGWRPPRKVRASELDPQLSGRPVPSTTARYRRWRL